MVGAPTTRLLKAFSGGRRGTAVAVDEVSLNSRRALFRCHPERSRRLSIVGAVEPDRWEGAERGLGAEVDLFDCIDY